MFEEFMTEIVVLNVILITIVIYLVRKLIELNSEFNQFKSQKDNDILEARKDSNKKQRATIKGQITETIAPWSMTVVNSVSELNFLGNPIDFIGFKGLDGDGDIDIKFIEVKSGNCLLYTSPSPRDKRQSRMPSSA